MRSNFGPFALSLCLLVSGMLAAARPSAASELKWEHEETKELIDLVRSAVEVVGEKGVEEACTAFREEGSRWRQGEVYVFIIAMDGTAVCHPARPELEGRILLEMRDPRGKPIVRNFLRELEGGSEEGWVHYYWPRPGERAFHWKTTYIHRAAGPDGVEVMVGSGRYQMPMERFFVVEQVNDAVALIREKGAGAFDEFRDPSSGFLFYDAYLFVFDSTGKTLVNVAFPDQEGQNAADLQDADGKPFIREMLDLVANGDSGWVDYRWPKEGDTVPSRKSSYVRRVELDGRALVVGAGLYLE